MDSLTEQNYRQFVRCTIFDQDLLPSSVPIQRLDLTSERQKKILAVLESRQDWGVVIPFSATTPISLFHLYQWEKAREMLQLERVRLVLLFDDAPLSESQQGDVDSESRLPEYKPVLSRILKASVDDHEQVEFVSSSDLLGQLPPNGSQILRLAKMGIEQVVPSEMLGASWLMRRRQCLALIVAFDWGLPFLLTGQLEAPAYDELMRTIENAIRPGRQVIPLYLPTLRIAEAIVAGQHHEDRIYEVIWQTIVTQRSQTNQVEVLMELYRYFILRHDTSPEPALASAKDQLYSYTDIDSLCREVARQLHQYMQGYL